jgi:hypothetical protein
VLDLALRLVERRSQVLDGFGFVHLVSLVVGLSPFGVEELLTHLHPRFQRQLMLRVTVYHSLEDVIN